MISNTPWFDPSRAVVIYNGIGFSRYDTLRLERDGIRRSIRNEFGLAPDSVLITHVGELTARKGHRFIIEAAGEVIRAFPGAHFLFAGDGDARSAIQEQILEHGLGGYIHLLGFRDDIPEILTASDVLVLPSSVEGFGYVLAEAMAASLPVVATRASSIPEVVEDTVTGLLHDAGNSVQIAAHLRLLLGDSRLRERMGAAGYRRAREHFHIDRMVSELERLFFS